MSKPIVSPCSSELPVSVSGWRSKQIALRYSVSYVKLFEVTFRALEDPEPFDPHRQPSDEVVAPVVKVPDGYDVVVARHQVLAAGIPTVYHLPQMIRYAPRQLSHFYTDLRGGPDLAFRSMSSKTRATVVRKVRNFEKFCGGSVQWRMYATAEEMLEYYDLARSLAAKTYQQRLFDAGLPGSESFRAQMIDLAKRDLVRGFVLFHGGKAIAYLYTPAPDGFLVYDYLGYDADYGQHSPGTVLQYLALKALYEERRFQLYYWGFGYSQTKHIFSTGQVLAADVYYFRSTLRNRLAVWMHHRVDTFADRAGRLAERLGVKQRIRRWLKRS